MNGKRNLACAAATAVTLLGLFPSCGGGGGGGGDGGGFAAPADSGAFLPTVGLISAAAGDGSARVAWRASDPDGNPVAVALFRSTSGASVYQGAPIAVGPSGQTLEVGGLPNGQDQYFGLALATGGGQYTPAGEILMVRPGAPLYVDAASTAQSPDGLTPATAFSEPLSAVLTAFAAGGGNVWIAAGDYNGVSLPVRSGVHVYGGFDASFTLAARDPATQVTRLIGFGGQPLVEITSGGAGAVLDGLVLDGAGAATFGVDVDETPAQLRSLEISSCGSHGIRARSNSTTSVIDLCVTRCRVSANGSGGLSLKGAFDLGVQNSRFSSNRIEGLELGSLVSHEGQAVDLVVRDSVFSGNGNEGLDCDLAAPPIPGPAGATYKVVIEHSLFERNGTQGAPSSTAGLNLDIDFELVPGWTADIAVRGCTARGNAGPGVRLDLDSTSDTIVHRLASSGNGGDGLLVSSESTPGVATVSSSAFLGNQGAGVRAVSGNVPVLVSHSVLAGNRNGGVVSEVVESAVVSSVAWLQPSFLGFARGHFNVEVTDPLAIPFQRVPVEFQRLGGFTGGALQVEDASGLALGDTIEVGDDGVARAIAGFGAGQAVLVTPSPSSVPLPTSFARFPSPGAVLEDLRLSAGSAAASAGMPDPVAGFVDAGVYGSPSGGPVGREEVDPPTLWFVDEILPAPGTAVGAGASLVFGFADTPPSGATVSPQTVRVLDASGSSVAATAFVQNGQVVIDPPMSGWPSGALLVELHTGLASTAGTALATPVVVPFQVQ